MPPKIISNGSDLRRYKTSIKIYLSIYNMVHAIGWGWVFFHILFKLYTCGTNCLSEIYKDTEIMVIFLQLLVFIDLLHDYLEFVPPPDMNIFVRIHCKILRRAHIYFVGVYFVREVQKHIAVTIMIFLWGLLDLIRYPFYALNTWKLCPSWLYWLRYSEFLILYPIGFVSEVWVWFLMFPFFKERSIHSYYLKEIPWIGFNYYYFSLLYVLYRFISLPVNYNRMLGMRFKRLNKKSKTN